MATAAELEQLPSWNDVVFGRAPPGAVQRATDNHLLIEYAAPGEVEDTYQGTGLCAPASRGTETKRGTWAEVVQLAASDPDYADWITHQPTVNGSHFRLFHFVLDSAARQLPGVRELRFTLRGTGSSRQIRPAGCLLPREVWLSTRRV